MRRGIGRQRALWSAVIFLALIGVAIGVRRTLHLVPIVAHGYRPPAVSSNPRLAQLTALDDLFARHPILTLGHIVPGMLFMILGPLQFNSRIRARHLRWHRLSGRVFVAFFFVLCGSCVLVGFYVRGRRRGRPAWAAGVVV